jgi:hypothetical protein
VTAATQLDRQPKETTTMTAADPSTADPSTAHLGFAIGRLLADPSFRKRLKHAGYNGQPVVPLAPSSTAADLLARIDDTDGPVLLAFADSGYPHGLRLAWLEEQTPSGAQR